MVRLFCENSNYAKSSPQLRTLTLEHLRDNIEITSAIEKMKNLNKIIIINPDEEVIFDENFFESLAKIYERKSLKLTFLTNDKNCYNILKIHSC